MPAGHKHLGQISVLTAAAAAAGAAAAAADASANAAIDDYRSCDIMVITDIVTLALYVTRVLLSHGGIHNIQIPFELSNEYLFTSIIPRIVRLCVFLLSSPSVRRFYNNVVFLKCCLKCGPDCIE